MLKFMTAFFERFASWIGWGALGFIVSLVGVILAINFQKTEVHVFELGNTNLVDIKNPLNDLQILYNNRDLTQENLSLRLYRIQVQNTGNTSIRKQDFDDDDLWGVQVSSGSIVNPSAPSSDLKYIRDNLKIKTPNETTLRFTPIIFDPGDSFTLDFFVLSTSTQPVELQAVGKIAGIKRITVTKSNLDRPSILYEAFWGRWDVLALRMLAAPLYIIILILLIWGIAGPVLSITSWQRRRKITKILADNGVLVKNHGVRTIIDRYAAVGTGGVEQIVRALERKIANQTSFVKGDRTLSDSAAETLLNSGIVRKDDRTGAFEIDSDRLAFYMFRTDIIARSTRSPAREMRRLVENGILEGDDGIKVDPNAFKALTVLTEFFGIPSLNKRIMDQVQSVQK